MDDEGAVGDASSREVFFELTRSLCPECRRVIDAKVLLRDQQVFLRKRCPDHGWFEARIYGDADAYVAAGRFNKPGTIPMAHSTAIDRGCPYDCGLCPDHGQHICVGIIEVNTACNMACPLCFADAGAGYNLTLAEVEDILDHFVATEGHPEVVQFSGGEPTIHPHILDMVRAAKARDIRQVMINTNGKRIADDDRFLERLAELRPSLYFQFDGFESRTYGTLRGEPDLLPTKLRALDRLAEAGLSVILVPAVERGVNLHEVGRLVEFGIKHPAVRGINFQPAFHAGRHPDHDPLNRITIPDIVSAIAEQTDGAFLTSDFIPVPCCFPTCRSITYLLTDGEHVAPIPRLLDIEEYLDYVSNRVIPDLAIRDALESLWSASAVMGTENTNERLRKAAAALECADACGINLPEALAQLTDRVFAIVIQDFLDPFTLNVKQLMKCCVQQLTPDGRLIPFCAYNSVGYREQVREQLTGVPVPDIVPNAAPLAGLLADSPHGSKHVKAAGLRRNGVDPDNSSARGAAVRP